MCYGHTMSLAVSTVAALLIALAGAPLAPPSAEEQRFFAEGVRAYEAGDARAAERAFKAGYAVARDPAFLVRIGEAQEKAGAPAEAAETYRRYLHEAPDASDRADIEQRLARLPPAPASPHPGAAPDGAETPGELGAGARQAVPLAPAPPAGGAPRAPAAADTEGPRGGAGAGEEEDLGWTPLRIGAWASAAVTVAALGTAAFFGASAASKEGDINKLILFREPITDAPLEYGAVAAGYESAVDDGEAFARNAKIALGVAAAAAVASTVFFILESRRAPEGRLAIARGGGGSGGGRRDGTGAAGTLSWTF